MSELPTGTVTFVFTDIEGSTAMLQRLGDSFVEVLEDHNRSVRSAFFAGTEVRSEGDAFFYAFPSAPDAVEAAVEAQRALDAVPWPEGGSVRVRIGMHTGEGVIGGDDYVGLDVHRAARIAAAGHGGQILVSESTRVLAAAAVSGDVSVRDLGEHRFKDLEALERVYQVVVRDLPAEFPPIRSLDAAPNNLPSQPTAFVGRREEVASISSLLLRAGLVTLTGPGGSGKTRLAINVASGLVDQYPDGVSYVPLESIRGSELVIPAIADRLGVGEAESPLDALADVIGNGSRMLVLDNFEHVTEAAAEVATLVGRAPEAAFLVTSQTPLRIRGEQIFPVPPLDPVEGVDLFVELVAATDPAFELTEENRDLIEQIVRRLEGMPLAIELMAPSVRLFGLAGLDDRLAQRLDIPTAGYSDLPERHQTLASAIAWSYELLGEGEQSLLRQLAVFDGGFTMDAAESVAVPDPVIGVVEGVALLLDRSLLWSRVARGEARFFMLDAIRQFALDALTESGKYDEAAQRHGEYIANLAETARPILMGEGQEVWLDRLADEHDNIRAVLRRSRDTGQPDLGLRTAGSIWSFYHRRGHLAEARSWLEELLDLPGASPLATAEGTYGLASVVYWQGEPGEAHVLYLELLGLFRDLGDDIRVADTLHALSATSGWIGDHDASLAYADEARAAFEQAGSVQGAIRVTSSLAFLALTDGRLEESLEMLTEARAQIAAAGDAGEQRQSDVAISAVFHKMGRTDEALALLGSAVEEMVDANDVSGTIMTLDFIAAATAATSPEPAVRLAGAADRLRTEMGGGLSAEVFGVEPVRSAVKPVMDGAAIEAAWAAGSNLSLDEAVELGRDLTATGRPAGG